MVDKYQHERCGLEADTFGILQCVLSLGNNIFFL